MEWSGRAPVPPAIEAGKGTTPQPANVSKCLRARFSGSFFTILLTVDVVFELINRELLITDYAFDKIAD